MQNCFLLHKKVEETTPRIVAGDDIASGRQ